MMGYCNIDHTLEDVQSKLREQAFFLPQHVTQVLGGFLQKELTQEQLNETFHLLKKYDLLSEEEKEERNKKIVRFAAQFVS